MTRYLSFSSKDTEKLGERIARALPRILGKRKGAMLVSLQGDLGSGKTTLVKGLFRALGVRGRVLSPTFILVRRARISGKNDLQHAFHADAYRLRSKREASTLGLSEALKDKRNLLVVEWPERLPRKMLARALRVELKHGKSEKERILDVSAKI